MGRMEDAYLLSQNQSNIWNLEKSFPATSINNICETIRIKGRFDIFCIQQTLNLILEADETLRTRIRVVEGTPLQYVVPFENSTFPVYDFSMASESGFHHWEQAVTREVMGLVDAPLFHFYIFRLGESEGGILLKTHHLISDGWSQMLISNRIAKVYLELLAGKKPQLEGTPSYRLHLEKERAYMDSSAYGRDLKFWSGKVAGPVEPAALKECRSAHISPVGQRKSYELPEVLNLAIYGFCEKFRVSPFAVFYMALAIYLKRMGGGDAFSIGVPIFNRADRTDRETTGMFVSTLPFFGELKESWSLVEFNDHLAEAWFELLRHQRFPFEEIGRLAREHHPAMDRLFHIVLSYQNGTVITGADASVSFSGQWHYSGYQAEQLCIHLSNMEDIRHYSVSYDYLAQFFTDPEIESLHQYLVNILFQALSHPEEPIQNLSVVGIEEQETVLFRFNRTNRPLKEDTVYGRLAGVAGEFPSRAAVIERGVRHTYRAFLEDARRIGGAILAMTPEPDQPVALFLPRSYALLKAMAGAAAAGRPWVIVPPELPEGRIHEILQSSGAVMVGEGERDERLPSGPYLDLTKAGACSPYACPASPKDLAYIVYTSGSTGKPKGVEIEHRNLINFAAAMRPLYGHGAVLSLCNIGFDVFILESMVSLLNGQTIVLPEKEDEHRPAGLARLIRDYGVGFLALTPSRLAAYMKHPDFLKALQRIESIVCGGESLTGSLLQELQNVTSARIYNQYGPSEATIGVSYKRMNGASAITIGRPMDNCRLYVLDEQRHPLPVGVYGELYIGGLCVGRGYHGAPELTRSAFMPSPFVHGERMYRTGDVACWTAEGEVMLAGRRDSQIKLRGLRIEPQEIASRLEAYPAVKAAAVKAKVSGQSTVLIAYYAAESAIEETELLRFLAGYLPGYMIPSRLQWVREIPLTANGKVDYDRLPEPEEEAGLSIVGEMGERIVGIFRQVLGRPEMDGSSDYFLFGGDSLNALETLGLIEKKLGVLLKVEDLATCRTARRLERLLDGGVQAASGIQPAPAQSSYPLTPAQQSIYFETRIDPTGLSYNMPGAFRMQGSLDREVLEKAFRRLIDEEPIFRTAFRLEENELRQVVLDSVPFDVNILSGTYDEAVRAFVRPFDLSAPPLIRAALWRDSEGDVLFMDIHHIVSDGLSSALVTQRLNDLLAGRSVKRRLNYLDYACWRTEHGRKPEKLNYWKEALRDVPSLELPLDHPRPKTPDGRGRKRAFHLDKEKTEDLLVYCKKRQISLFSLLMGTFGILLSRVSGNGDFAVGTPVAGRGHSELQDMLGLFIQTLPLRLCPKGDVEEYLAGTHRRVIAMLDHQDVSLDDVMTAAGVRRSFGQNVLYNTLFSLRPISDRGFALDGHALSYLAIDTGTAKLDLSLEAAQSEDGLDFYFEYATALFDEGTIDFYGRCYLTLLDAVRAGGPVEKLQILPVADQYEFFEKPWRRRTPYMDLPLDRQIDQVAAVDPKRTALVFHGERISFGELKTRSDRLAMHLIRSGALRGDVIGLLMTRTPGMIAAMLAILKAGCAYLPVLASYPEKRISYMLENGGAKFLLHEPGIELPDLPCPALAAAEAEGVPAVEGRTGEDLMYVLYTSGSTGQPKGVMLQHRALENLLVSIEEIMAPSAGPVLCSTSIVFDTFITENLLPLALGRGVVLADDEEMMLPWKLAELIETQGAEFVQFTPSRLQMCLGNDAFRRAMARVKGIILVGEALSAQLLKKLQDTGDVQIFNMYGPTEAAVYVTVGDMTKEKQVTIGKPLHNCRLYVLDKDGGLALPTAQGELYLAGECLAQGYINRPDLTEEAFLPDPFFPGQRMYRSGDLARLRLDGTFDFLGRRDGQVKINGQRIELSEIAGEMMASGLVRESAVIAVPSAGTKELRAFVVPEAGYGEDKLRNYLAKNLPRVMVPSRIEAVEALPRTASGKTDLKALEKGLTADAPAAASSSACGELTALWEKALGGPVDPAKSFFEQGGTSLSALNLLGQYFNRHWTLTLEQFYDHPTLTEQAALLGAADGGNRVGDGEIGVTAPPEKTAALPAALDGDLFLPSGGTAGPLSAGSASTADRSLSSPAFAKGKAMLLTGGTGYLGAHLIRALMEAGYRVICPIRGGSRERLLEGLIWYFGKGWTAAHERDVEVLAGDISLAGLGLSADPGPIAGVLHAAADVRHYGDKAASLRTNREGTAHVIAFAEERQAPLYHISTVSVSGEHLLRDPGREVVYTEDDFEIGQNWRENIYVRGKFMAEQLVREAMDRGLRGKIFRVGHLVGRSDDGVFQKNPEGNSLYAFVQGIRHMDCMPEGYGELPMELTAVDLCAEAIVTLLKGEARVYHAFNPDTLTLKEMVEAFRGPVPQVPVEVFERHLGAKLNEGLAQELSMLLDFWTRTKLVPMRIRPSAKRTAEEMEKLGFIWPKTDIGMLLKAF
ncbi:non-ribosomal peptide synthetase [Gehongia tenuis]|nr:non-ribosomal peptide synthetase [Gehongia tenuis]